LHALIKSEWRNNMMIKTLFSTAVLLIATSGLSQAAFEPKAGLLDDRIAPMTDKADTGTVIQEAKRGRGGDNNRSSGGSSDDNSSSTGSNSNNNTSGSGRRKPRIPGGSGCDDAGDVAEHPECRG
jgi:hypothetical protein